MKKNEMSLLENLFGASFFDTSIFDKQLLNGLKMNQIPSNSMKTDIIEKDGEYQIEVDVPGIDKQDIDISLEDGYLTISAQKETNQKDEKEGYYIRQERYYGSQSRKIYVGDDVTEEDIKAKFNNGVIIITIPKKEQKSNKKKINID